MANHTSYWSVTTINILYIWDRLWKKTFMNFVNFGIIVNVFFLSVN